jgi:uncharacterized protein
MVGFVLGRRRFFAERARWRPALGRWLLPAALVGLAANAVVLLAQRAMVHPFMPSLAGLVAQAALAIGAPALCLAYVAAIGVASDPPRLGPRLALLAAPGRMALTNYLAHSVVCTLLFYGYGLGLFGTVPPWQGLALTFLLWLVQIPASHAWLARFRFGPVEWLWRSATYGRLQPLRRHAPAVI